MHTATFEQMTIPRDMLSDGILVEGMIVTVSSSNDEVGWCFPKSRRCGGVCAVAVDMNSRVCFLPLSLLPRQTVRTIYVAVALQCPPKRTFCVRLVVLLSNR